MDDDGGRLNEEARQAWENNADWWDEYVGAEGNVYHRVLVAPAQLRLLQLRPGERVLEIACGNGQFAREMAQHGVEVLAFDFSERFIERATRHTAGAGITGIDYRIADATDYDALLSFGAGFDAAVSTMALMDIATIDPLLRALTALLKPDGRFVFSVQHPCFNSSGCQMVARQAEGDGELVTVHSVEVTSYVDVPPKRGTGIIGQPVPHYYFHRTISELFNACFRFGFVLDGIEEPAFTGEVPSGSALGWRNYTQIPPVLVARMRMVERGLRRE